MTKKPTTFHLDIQTHRKNPYGLLRTSYREDGKVKKETIGRFSGLSLEQLRVIQAAIQAGIQGKAFPQEDFKIISSREYGASFVCVELLKRLGLDQAIYSRSSEDWVRSSLAMIAGRLVYSGSKLSLSHSSSYSALWNICGIDDVDVNIHCYDAMDQLLHRQDAIQKILAKKHLHDGILILYDITSSYMEGEYDDSDLVCFGYNRDQKRGHEQIVISLLCSKDGCPIAVEVLKGNTKDETTVLNKINEINTKYGLKTIIFVGDRGMVTQANYDEINHDTVKVISALRHSAIKSLCDKGTIQLSMFDEKNIVEVIDGKLRYCLCKNPDMARKEAITRQALLQRTKEKLDAIASSTRKSKNSKEVRAGKVINKFKVGKFFAIEGIGDNLSYTLNNEKIAQEAALDGCYIIYSDVAPKNMTALSIVENYKNLMRVEQAFRSMKTVHLEIRPVFHKKDERIQCHVFICMLAYYVMWHIKLLIKPIFDTDGNGKKRKYTFDSIMKILKCIRQETVEFCNAKTHIITKPTEEQKHILNLLEITM